MASRNSMLAAGQHGQAHEHEAQLAAHQPSARLEGPASEWDAIAVSCASGTAGGWSSRVSIVSLPEASRHRTPVTRERPKCATGDAVALRDALGPASCVYDTPLVSLPQ